MNATTTQPRTYADPADEPGSFFYDRKHHPDYRRPSSLVPVHPAPAVVVIQGDGFTICRTWPATIQ